MWLVMFKKDYPLNPEVISDIVWNKYCRGFETNIYKSKICKHPVFHFSPLLYGVIMTRGTPLISLELYKMKINIKQQINFTSRMANKRNLKAAYSILMENNSK
jgi:hypothetical protein